MFNFKDYIETDIEEKKTIANVMPKNTAVRKRKYLETLNQIKTEYEGHKDRVREFINYNYDKLLPHKEEQRLHPTADLKRLIELENPLTTCFEKLKLDQYMYVLMHYYNYSIEHLNQTLDKIVSCFQDAGITLTEKDFKLNIYSYQYMSCFFKEYFIINNDYSLEHFQNIYWKCPNVFLYLVVNIRMIFQKYAKNLENYVKNTVKRQQSKLEFKTTKELFNRFQAIQIENTAKQEETEYDIVNLCLEKKIDINYYRPEANNIESDYNFFTIEPVDLTDSEQKANFLESLSNLRYNLMEYQLYLKYQPVIDYFSNNYQNQTENGLKTQKLEIKNKLKAIKKLENSLIWKENTFKNRVSLKYLTEELDENTKNKLSVQDKLLVEIYNKYLEYDELYYEGKVKSILKTTSKASDIFCIVKSYPLFSRQIIKKTLEVEERQQIADIYKEIDKLLYNPYRKIIDMIPVFEKNNIPQILMNGYRFENLNVTEDSFDDMNIKIIFERSDKIFRELKIRKFKLSIDQIEFLVAIDAMKKNNQI